MPWDHCGLQVLDDQLCPTCGTRKPSWTTRLDRTRRLVLTRESDNGDQIETLEDAADVGSPFCEECQEQDEQDEDEAEDKEASETEAESETSEAEASEAEPEPDVDAQVDSLETASDSGAPFCEECQEQDAEDEGEDDA